MPKPYKTFSEQFCLEEATFLQRQLRNFRLLKFMFFTVIGWAKAKKVREEFKSARENGEVFYVDRFAPPDESKS
ncbi:MAG: hypothetical protein GKR93_09005 [Gammaproteobacteria bacterium]|nr:hypothetical protein [Gammaproteobacteria bacterium]